MKQNQMLFLYYIVKVKAILELLLMHLSKDYKMIPKCYNFCLASVFGCCYDNNDD